MKSRPGIFIGLMALFVALTVSLGLVVVRQSQRKEPQVALQNAQYEQRKMEQQSKTPVNSDSHDQQSTQSLTPVEQPSGQDSQTPTSPPQTQSMQVFFSKHPDSDSDPTVVVPVDRVLPDGVSQQDALIQLFAGPTDDEQQAGYYGGILLRGTSTCAGKDFTLTISNSLATVLLCRQHISRGSTQDTREESQIAATLKQFGGIKGVAVLDQNGKCIYARDTNVCPNNSSQ